MCEWCLCPIYMIIPYIISGLFDRISCRVDEVVKLAMKRHGMVDFTLCIRMF